MRLLADEKRRAAPLLLQRQRERKRAAFAQHGLDPDFAAVRFHGEAAEGEAEARALAQGFPFVVCDLHEFLKKAAMILGGDALPVVAHADGERMVRMLNLKLDVAADRRVL